MKQLQYAAYKRRMAAQKLRDLAQSKRPFVAQTSAPQASITNTSRFTIPLKLSFTHTYGKSKFGH